MLSLKLEQVQSTCNRLTQQNKELEDVFRNALDENKKLQDSLDLRQKALERQNQEREVSKNLLFSNLNSKIFHMFSFISD